MRLLNIADYGAKENELSTAAIQRAIDECEYGDTVYIPSGRYISGALYLKSGINLQLDENARLEGSVNTDDYPLSVYRFEGIEQLCYASLINTYDGNHENITISGKGVIDACGAALFAAEMSENKGKRGRAVCIRNTDSLRITGVTIRQSPAWCLHLIYCRDIEITDVEIHSKYDEYGNRYEGIYNGDGIDIDSCSNVRISESFIESQDDCIALKSGFNEEGRRAGIPTENVLIESCRFHSGFGVAIGSEMSGGIQNVTVRGCQFKDSFSIASIKAPRGRGGQIENIRYEDCTLVNSDKSITDGRWFRGALYVDSFYGLLDFDESAPEPIDEGTPVIDGIYFKNITLTTVGGTAVYLCGLPEMPLGFVCMENVRAVGTGALHCANVGRLLMRNTDIRASEDPLTEDFGDCPINTI